MADRPGEATKQDGTKGKKKRSKLLLLVLVLLVAAGAAAAYNHFHPEGFPIIRKVAAEEKAALKSRDFGSIVVNLADNPGNRFFRIALVLEYTEAESVEKEITEKGYRIRDGLVFLLRQKTSAELRAPEAADELRNEILEEFNRHLETGRIQHVYFTDFIIQ